MTLDSHLTSHYLMSYSKMKQKRTSELQISQKMERRVLFSSLSLKLIHVCSFLFLFYNLLPYFVLKITRLWSLVPLIFMPPSTWVTSHLRWTATLIPLIIILIILSNFSPTLELRMFRYSYLILIHSFSSGLHNPSMRLPGCLSWFLGSQCRCILCLSRQAERSEQVETKVSIN